MLVVVIGLRDPQQYEDVLCFHQLRAGAEGDSWMGGILHLSFNLRIHCSSDHLCAGFNLV